MSIYEECKSILRKSAAHVTEGKPETVSLLAFPGNEFHTTAPERLRSDAQQLPFCCREVYYISDLHLEEHILKRFRTGAENDQIEAYIHGKVKKLFKGDLEASIKQLKSPVVLFGGDIASSFSVGQLFYRDFVSTWLIIQVEAYERKRKDEFDQCKQALAEKQAAFEYWKKENLWTAKLRKPLLDYSDKRVSPEIKRLISQIQALQKRLDELNTVPLEKQNTLPPYIYAVLGNHELWGFSSYETCDKTYSKLFAELGINYLNGNLFWLGEHSLPGSVSIDPETRQLDFASIREEDRPDEYARQMVLSGNVIITGSIGFSANNEEFNANQGIYGQAITREEEIKRCEEWRSLYASAIKASEEVYCPLVILTHSPISDWWDGSEMPSNCVFFHGHTHKNIAYSDENNTFIFADNQIGYTSNRFHFKKAWLYNYRNPFASDPDGYREITTKEYLEFNCFVREFPLPGLGMIEYQRKTKNGKLYMIKQDGYYGFFLENDTGTYVCNGGLIQRTGYYGVNVLERINYEFIQMVSAYLLLLSPLRRFQESISSYIKSFGGTGKIHGTIVDISFFSHIMVNTSDFVVTYYYAPFMGAVQHYPSLGELLQKHEPELEAKYLNSGAELALPVFDRSDGEDYGVLEKVDIKNSQYAVSRRINALQRLFDKHTLRAWNPDILNQVFSEDHKYLSDN